MTPAEAFVEHLGEIGEWANAAHAKGTTRTEIAKVLLAVAVGELRMDGVSKEEFTELIDQLWTIYSEAQPAGGEGN